MEINSLEDAFVNLGTENLTFANRNCPAALNKGLRLIQLVILFFSASLYIFSTSLSYISKEILYDRKKLEYYVYVLFPNYFYHDWRFFGESFDK